MLLCSLRLNTIMLRLDVGVQSRVRKVLFTAPTNVISPSFVLFGTSLVLDIHKLLLFGLLDLLLAPAYSLVEEELRS